MFSSGSLFSKDDLSQIVDRGSDPVVVHQQIERFKKGFPFAELVEPATLKRGITLFNEEEKAEWIACFDRQRKSQKICRFVPASGAATRMFKSLFELSDALKGKSAAEQEQIIRHDDEARTFFDSLSDYPFYPDLSLQGYESPLEVLDSLLLEEGLNYGLLPKGLLKFHRYGEQSRTAFEEHLHEAARMGEPGEEVMLHFTVSEEHLNGFKQLEKLLVPLLEKHYGTVFNITYSFQKAETDTIAVDKQNRPLRDETGKLVFRPGGHGALLQNLNDLEHDVVFVNNIDNISPDRNSEIRVRHKKMLGGLLMRIRNEAEELLSRLNAGAEAGAVESAADWLVETAGRQLPDNFEEWSPKEQVSWLISSINKPVRVCGMVKNEGEPGGGPFFVRDSESEVSPQIVESSQVDFSDQQQSEIFRRSSHFNPVDMACSLRSAGGESYDLTSFVDSNTGFISEKSVRGKALRALELPGLWNGSMAGWITVFVEVPAETFTPVKTIFDLVRPAHIS
ncbi:MAG: DUF4301 family protein [Bacteroidales bacterium]